MATSKIKLYKETMKQSKSGTYEYLLMQLERGSLSRLSKFSVGDSVNLALDGTKLFINPPKYDNTDTKIVTRTIGTHPKPGVYAIRFGGAMSPELYAAVLGVLSEVVYESKTIIGVLTAHSVDGTPGFYIDFAELFRKNVGELVADVEPVRVAYLLSEKERLESELESEKQYVKDLLNQRDDLFIQCDEAAKHPAKLDELKAVIAAQSSHISALSDTVVVLRSVSQLTANVRSAIELLNEELMKIEKHCSSVVPLESTKILGKDELIDATKKAIAHRGRDAVVGLIHEFGATKGSEVPITLRPVFDARLLALSDTH